MLFSFFRFTIVLSLVESVKKSSQYDTDEQGQPINNYYITMRSGSVHEVFANDIIKNVDPNYEQFIDKLYKIWGQHKDV